MFVPGSGELLVVGVLNLVADDLRVSIPAAGTLVTSYALGLAVGGPILAAVTIRLDQKVVLAGTLVLFAGTNLVAVLTTDDGTFLAARVLTGALQGLFIASAFMAGISVVPPDRMGRAIGVVVSGVPVSTALGVPLGTLVGQAIGRRRRTRRSPTSCRSCRASRASRSPARRVPPGLRGGDGGRLVRRGRFADRDAARTLVAGSVGIVVSLLALHLVGEVAVLVGLVLVAIPVAWATGFLRPPAAGTGDGHPPTVREEIRDAGVGSG